MNTRYQTDLDGVDWEEVKRILTLDDFDNGRTPAQLQSSFENSHVCCLAYDGDQVIGKARALSDGICNAYIVDVWVYSPYRNRGIARKMMSTLTDQLSGQHVYLFTENDTVDFYQKLGFEKHGIGLGKLIGEWLVNET